MKCLYSLLAFIFFAMALAARKAKNELVKKDVPLIACDVCKRTIGMVYNTTEQERQDAPYNKLNEIDINDIVENICNHESKTGEWIRGLDIVEVTEGDKTYLNLVAPGGLSRCESECKTIANSCEALMGDEIDRDSLTATLWKNKATLEDLEKKLCKKRCKTRKPVPNSYKREDKEFKVMSEKDIQMEEMMANMQAAGMGGMKMMNRDDMDDMYGMGDMYDDEDMEDMYGGGGMGGMPFGMPGMGDGGSFPGAGDGMEF